LVNNMSWGESVLTPVEARGPKSVEAQVASTKAREITEAEQKRIDFNNRCELLQSDLRAAEQLVAAAPSTVTLIPFPGFVIKTTRPSDFESKVFINVFHHTRVVDERMMLTYVPPFTTEELAAGGMVGAFNDDNNNSNNNIQQQHQQQENRSPNSIASAAGRAAKGVSAPAPVPARGPHSEPLLTTASLPSVIRMEPLIYVSEATSTSDKDGFVWRLYNVLVSSSYLSREVVSAQTVHITDRTSVNRVSQAVRLGIQTHHSLLASLVCWFVFLFVCASSFIVVDVELLKCDNSFYFLFCVFIIAIYVFVLIDYSSGECPL
jgi:hypothetical protein